MKYITYILITFFLIQLNAPVYAKEPVLEIHDYLNQNNGLNSHFHDIKSIAIKLSPTEREHLFNYYQKDSKEGLLYNLIPGGVGSFLMGDNLGGFGIIFTQILLVGSIAFFHYLDQQPSSMGVGFTVVFAAIPALAISGLISLFSMLLQPFIFASTYNQKLKQALLMN